LCWVTIQLGGWLAASERRLAGHRRGGATLNDSAALIGGELVANLPGGILFLNGSNTYNGGTTVNNGTLEIADGALPGATAGPDLTFAGNGVLQWASGFDLTRSTYVCAGYTLTADSQSTSAELSGVLSGPGNLTVIDSGNTSGSGALALDAENTFTGVTTVGTGETLTLMDPLALQDSTFDTSGLGALSFGTLSSLNPVELGGLQGSGSLSLANASSSPIALTVGGNNTDTTFSGALSGVLQSSFDKVGIGTLTLTGASRTYTGSISVSAGILNVQNSSALGTMAGGVSVSDGAALQLQRGVTMGAGSLSLAGTGVGGGGALESVSGISSWAGPIYLNSGSGITRINCDADTLTLSGGIQNGSGSGHLTIGGLGNVTVAGSGVAASVADLTEDGSGTLALLAANSSIGNTYIGTTATLQLGDGINSANNGTVAGPVFDNGRLVFAIFPACLPTCLEAPFPVPGRS